MVWQKGVAFVRGINMYGSNRISKSEMLELCKKIENENIRILQIVKSDTVLFEKRSIHYASVGGALEKVLSGHFGKPVYVTARSIKTLRRCLYLG